MTVSREDIRAARDDLSVFARIVGWPLEPWQAEALRLDSRFTVIVSNRQAGKTRGLSLLACWWAFRKPGQRVLVVSASEDSAVRLLRQVREVAAHELLKHSVIDETGTRLIVSNGSEVRSVPASERAVRGHSVDLLLVDECALVSDDLLLGAALPTTAARPDARLVFASSPWGDSGAFHSFAAQGEDEAFPHIRTFTWRLSQCWWIDAATVEAARASMSPQRFASEYEGSFVGSGDLFYDRADILACTASYPLVHDGGRAPVTCGLDWGRRRDAHAIVLAGVLEDRGRNGSPVAVIPYLETSRRPYGAQVSQIVELTRRWRLRVASETNGVGQFPTEELRRRLGHGVSVREISTTADSKENAYGRVAVMLAERSLVIPDHEQFLRQLGGISAQPTPSGGLRIMATSEATHDDLPDALSLAVSLLPGKLPAARGRLHDDGAGHDGRMVTTPDGVEVPVPLRLRGYFAGGVFDPHSTPHRLPTRSITGGGKWAIPGPRPLIEGGIPVASVAEPGGATVHTRRPFLS